ncbi:phenylacetate--CoA ligase family protein [Methanogenium sp. S4BF]|uniref:AMP-binding protein n=1 Tax=Methanogenium sp. S4BF TaxID=1789226 RepID=UPI002416DCD7|nr:AMP-binding protein [Methanogenium sp. S4BF]WFN35014.1 phenylacetate--CoA ligase family protein [Methanogenium sp. S4BF]
MLEKVYKRFRQSPDALRKVMYLIPIERRLGGLSFSRRLRSIKETDKLPKEELLKIQERELAKLLNYAVKNIPYYKNIELDSSKDAFSNLLKFPIIDKETIQKCPDLFINKNIPISKRYSVTTGGTSGNTLQFYLDNSTYGEEWAFIVSMWGRVNYTPGDRIAAFRGVEFNHITKDKFWQLNPLYNALEFSPFHMSEKNLPHYLSAMKKWHPSFIHGYPSAVNLLAHYLDTNQKSDISKINAVLAGSENIYPGQIEFIEKALNTRFFSWYGQSEKVILAGECEHSHIYHIFPQYGYTEIIDDNGEIISWENVGKRGELVGTGFLNNVMPFIRYKTGDFATIAGWGCKDCGRDYPLIKDVRGRWTQEMIVSKNGAQISMTALNMHSDAFQNVRLFQFYQEKKGEVVLHIIRKDTYTDNDSQNILQALHQKMGEDVQVQLQFVDEIPRTKSGKYKFLIQKLSNGNKDDKSLWNCSGIIK